MTPATPPPADWPLRRAIGNALGLQPYPPYDWAWQDADDKVHPYAEYETDLNAAMTLTEPYAFKLTSVHSDKGRIGYMATIEDRYEQGGTGHAATPALAICYAWLRYTELYTAAAGEAGA